MQAGSVTGGVHFHHGERFGGPKPQQLPADVRGFVDREGVLRELGAVLTSEPGEPFAVSVCVIAGSPGVGKTSLAVRWAHQIRDRFPDGQLYVNLRGYDPGRPMSPHEALHHFLSSFHAPNQAIPADLEARAALYRSYLADRRVLVVVDNAGSTRQVRPLLPGTAGCLTLITSRSRLSGLVVRDGARRITLGTLAEPEAVALLRVVTSGHRAGDDENELAELARLCARLPLALRIAAERAARRPRMCLDELIAALRDESAIWDTLSADNDEEADAMRTVFAWSYRALPKEAADLFRVLGLHPSPAFHVGAAAALAGIRTTRALHLLDVLEGAHLLTEAGGQDRYELHDLLRAYATDQARQEMTDAEREDALRRLLAWYLHSVDAALSQINPRGAHIPLDPPGEHVTPLSFADRTEATRWYEEERSNLLAAVRAAAEAGLDRLAWQLPAVLRGVQMAFNPFDEWLAMGEIGLRAARRAGDRAGEGEVLESLGLVCLRSYRLDEAGEYFGAGLTMKRELGNRLGEGLLLTGLGLVRLRQRRLDEAEELFARSLALLTETGSGWAVSARENLATVCLEKGDLERAEELLRESLAHHGQEPGGEGNALRLLAAVLRERGEVELALETAERAVEQARGQRRKAAEGYWLLELGAAQQASGRLGEALESFHRSAVLHRRLGDRAREARGWHATGDVYQAMERFEEAADFHRAAAGVQGQVGDAWQVALALDGLARARRAMGEDEEARGHWREALAALAAFSDARAAGLRARLARAADGSDGAADGASFI